MSSCKVPLSYSGTVLTEDHCLCCVVMGCVLLPRRGSEHLQAGSMLFHEDFDLSLAIFLDRHPTGGPSRFGREAKRALLLCTGLIGVE